MFIVVDNFLQNPYDLIQEVKRNIKIPAFTISQDNYPGIKVSTSNHIEGLIINKVKNILKNPNLICEELKYQVINKDFVMGIPHDDEDGMQSILFLNQNPKSNSGLELYRKKNDYLNGEYLNFMNYSLPYKEKFFSKKNKNFIDRMLYEDMIKKFKSNLERCGDRTIISNVFNRMVIFDSNQIHCAQKYFGTDVNNSRLSLVGFYR